MILGWLGTKIYKALKLDARMFGRLKAKINIFIKQQIILLNRSLCGTKQFSVMFFIIIKKKCILARIKGVQNALSFSKSKSLLKLDKSLQLKCLSILKQEKDL